MDDQASAHWRGQAFADHGEVAGTGLWRHMLGKCAVWGSSTSCSCLQAPVVNHVCCTLAVSAVTVQPLYESALLCTCAAALHALLVVSFNLLCIAAVAYGEAALNVCGVHSSLQSNLCVALPVAWPTLNLPCWPVAEHVLWCPACAAMVCASRGRG
jgi:hypothetical protein